MDSPNDRIAIASSDVLLSVRQLADILKSVPDCYDVGVNIFDTGELEFYFGTPNSSTLTGVMVLNDPDERGSDG